MNTTATNVTDLRLDVWGLVRHYLGPIQDLMEIEGVTEIMVNRYDEIYIECQGEKKRVTNRFENEAEINTCVEQIANALRQDVHKEKRPRLDARLSDGSRVNALLYPFSPRGTSLTIRLFPKKRLTIDDLITYGSLNQDMRAYLERAMTDEFNIVVSGSTGSGKTTMLNVISNFIADDERIISIEDTMELQITKSHVLPREAATRDMHSDSPVVTMNTLLENALRENPDRLVVGEVRTAAAAQTFLTAMNTGHSGIITTIHANSTEDSLERIEDLISGVSNKPFEAIQNSVRRNINILIFVNKPKDQDGRKIRRVTEIAEVQEGRPVLLWSWDAKNHKHHRSSESSIYIKG